MQISPVHYPEDHSSETVRRLVFGAAEDVLVIGDARRRPKFSQQSPERLAWALAACGAGLAYGDATGASVIDYQKGSLRDDFDFGPLVAVSTRTAREVLDRAGSADWKWGGLYDLRLRLSEVAPLVHVPEPLARVGETDPRASGEKQFDYVDPARRDYQLEMEAIATAHLERIGAWLPPRTRRVEHSGEGFPVPASVVIPVRNRAATIGDAIASALAQETDFEFNVLVVDNHSSDGTGEAIARVPDPRVVRVVPEATDLGIGGCWDLAIRSHACGRVAVQLDSDDIYAHASVLRTLVEKMRRERYAMLVAAYTTVDFELGEIAPGLVDHREWTAENGHNNALRINGLGAPRVFDVSVVRQVGFPNVSYGEDYAVGLRLSREYELGRVYDSVYLCRRWEGNTDSRLPPEGVNRHNAYKDWLRTLEIESRIAMNRAEAAP